MRRTFQLFILILPVFVFAQPDTTQYIIHGRTNSPVQQQKPYVILISADGFRNDLAEKYNAVNLKQFSSQGVAAKGMFPSYPSLTFPNHYTLVTGLYPAHHGLVDNTFFDQQKNKLYRIGNREVVEDGSWYGGTPLWVLAEQQQMISASFYWVGSEADVKGVRPTYYYRYSELIDIDRRVEVVKNWLTLPEAIRPHFITFYMSEVDHEEHVHGVDSKEAIAAVHHIDSAVARLVHMTDSLQLPVNFVFVSDHGMSAIDTVNFVDLPEAVADTNKFYIPVSDVLLHVYANNKSLVEPAYRAMKKTAQGYDVYKPNETPAHWHYTAKDDYYKRIGDLLLVPKWPRIFNLRKRKPWPGTHGFDNHLPDMRASFYAWGPAFKQNLVIDDFENVHVYPLIAKILGLAITEKIDGKENVLQHILR